MQAGIATEQRRGGKTVWFRRKSLRIKGARSPGGWHGIRYSWFSVTGNEPRAKKHILIADDDPSIRYMLSRVLLDEGYTVTTAASGEEGLKIAASEGIDLILLDLKMPGMCGQETLRELAAVRPGLPVIVITAYARQELGGGLAGVRVVLQKPLDFVTLLEMIQRLLAEAAAGKGFVSL